MLSASQVTTFPACGVEIATVGPDEAADYLVAAAVAGVSVEAHLCNAYTLSLVDYDAELRAALARGTLNLCDGTPLSWLGRRYGLPGPVRGPGLVGEVARRGVEPGVRHYLWGGAPGVAEKMAVRLGEHAPGVHIVGTESPPYHALTDEDLDGVAARAVAAEAQILWVGLGTPKQDYVVPRLASRLSLPVVPIGAAFEYWSGAVQEPSEWIHGTGLEWVHRLLSEPRRLWRRYLFGNPKFLLAVWRHRR